MFYVCFLNVFFSNLYLYNTVLFCVNKDIIIIIIGLIRNFSLLIDHTLFIV